MDQNYKMPVDDIVSDNFLSEQSYFRLSNDNNHSHKLSAQF